MTPQHGFEGGRTTQPIREPKLGTDAMKCGRYALSYAWVKAEVVTAGRDRH